MRHESESHWEDRPLLAARQGALSGLSAAEFLEEVLLNGDVFGRLAVVSSFGAESAVLLHHVAKIAPATPVIFIDTQFHFSETIAYRDELVRHLSLHDVQSVRIDPLTQKRVDPARALHRTDADHCCHVRKVEVLTRALRGFDGWITGQKRYQSGARAAIEQVEWDAPRQKWKFNPLADWKVDDIAAYHDRNALPYHPLRHLGYASIGCVPCTSPIGEAEDMRAGRWRGQQKRECGLHRNPNIIAASAA